MARIVILGGGFAAIAAAERLAGEIGEKDEITVISLSRDFTFYPALVPMVFGDFGPEDVKFELPPRLSERAVRFIQGDVIGIDPEMRTVKVVGDDVDGDVHFDYLLVAVGRRLATEKVPGFFEHAHHILGIKPALKFKEAVSEFKSGSIVVGLCPDAFLPVPVCEMALGLAKKFERQIRDKKVTVSAVFPSTLDAAFVGSELYRDLEQEFEQKGVKLVSNFPIDRVHENRIVDPSGNELPFDLLMLIPPFHGQPSLYRYSPITDQEGFIETNELMQVKGFDGIYAAGDIVSLPGPRFGYMAIRQGKVAANNIISELRNEEPAAEYSHKIAWVVGEKYTDPVFFHYGFWDETLEDFDENAFFGMAKPIRDRYGWIHLSYQTSSGAVPPRRKRS